MTSIALFVAKRGLSGYSQRMMSQAGDHAELADSIFRMIQSPEFRARYGEQAVLFKQFDATAINLQAHHEQRIGWDAANKAKHVQNVGPLLAMLSGVLTIADRYQKTGDAPYALTTGALDTAMGAVVGLPAALSTVGAATMDAVGLESHKPLATFLQTNVFSPDRYSPGLLDWLGEGASGASRWASRPDPIKAVTGTGEWLRRGTKGGLETIWDLTTGTLRATLDGMSQSKRPSK
jgi:hypothetical protein